MSRKNIFILVIGLCFSLFMFTSLLQPTTATQKDPNARGKALYVEYCASCHGVDGKGNGPVVPALKTWPGDLTTIAKRKGKFPNLEIQHYISGDVSVPAHGSREMPVWGSYFRQKKGQSVSTLNVYALTKYLESIQIN